MVPSAFRQYNQFVVAEKGTKKPINVNDPTRGTDHLNPVNWMTADDAVQWVNDNGPDNYCVGFVFTKDDPFFFLDIDKAYNNGQWSPIAVELCNRLAECYIEVSQSGTGLHIFGVGTPPVDHANKNTELGLELYTHGRYVALTGINARGDANQIANGKLEQTVADYFTREQSSGGIVSGWTSSPVEGYNGPEDDDQLIDKMLASKPSARAAFMGGATFRDLWGRNVAVLSDNYPDPKREYDESAADLSLASKLAFWTGGNCDRVERLMKRSGLVRDKWDSKRGKTTWLRELILKSVEDCSEFYKGPADTTDLLTRIEQDATTPEMITALAVQIGESGVDQIKREALVGKLVESAKLAGIDVSKTAVKNAATRGTDISGIGFIDLKANGKPEQTINNFRIMVQHYNILIRYNIISKEIEIMIPGIQALPDNYDNIMFNYVCDYAVRSGFDKSVDFVDRCIQTIAEENKFNPVATWVLSRPWDGVKRLPDLLNTLGQVPTPLTSTLVRRWLISGIRAAFNPAGLAGAGVLVLQGPQGAGKTRWLGRLFNNGDWFKDGAILDPTRPDSVRQVVKYWGVELGEIDATFKRSEIEALKGFLTSGTDEYRLPYARKLSKYPRRTVFAGSVNPDRYLNDSTGNRRFWTIAVTNDINPDHDIDVQQVWAEAYTWFEAGENWYLDASEQAQLDAHNKDHTSQTAWHELIASKYDIESTLTRPMTCTDIAAELAPGKSPNHKDLRHIGEAVREVFGIKSRKSSGRDVYDLPPLRLPEGFN